jgi:phage FluMu protein Com
MGRNQVQSSQSKKRNEEEDERDDEEEDEDERDDEEDDDDEEESEASKSTDPDDDDGGLDLDAALNDRTDRRESEYLKPWTKDGSTVVWLHTTTNFHKVAHHKWFEIVTYGKRGDEKSFIKRPRFNCHEPIDYAIKPNDDRDDDLRRKTHADLCPFCKMIEWVEAEMISGKMSPSQELFRFDDGNPKNLVSIHAGGISGLISLDSAPERWKKICKKDKVLQFQPWNENLYVKISILFQVVSDANPNSVLFAFEPPKLYQQLAREIKKQKTEHGDDEGNPQKNPYALTWEFDESVPYCQGYEVTATRKRPLSNKIKKLIHGPKRSDLKEKLAPGNCLELRASMENAAVIDMPFDEFFAAAKKAGLMNGSAAKTQSNKTAPKTKDDEEDEPKSDPKPKTSSKSNSAQVKGNAKKAEPEVVGTCDICGEGIGDDDIECKACGTTFDPDDDYHVDGIKCTDCGTVVPLKDASEEDGDLKQICPKCGTIHRLSPSVERFYGELRDKAFNGEVKFVWTAEPKSEAKKTEPKREGRSGRSKASNASSDSAKLDKKLKGDQVPF